MQRTVRPWAPILAATLVAVASARATDTVVYDNTATPTGARSFTALQIGDEVQLAGTARVGRELWVGLTQQGVSGTADLTARLYDGGGPGGAPGALLWESEGMEDVALSGADDLIRFELPAITLPDTVVWTIEISDARPVAVGLPHYGPPTVGSSPSHAWFGSPGAWTQQPDSDFMSRLVASDDAGLTLGVAASCPGGGPIQVSWSGATDGGEVLLAYADELGLFTVPPGSPCAGTEIDLGSAGLRVVYLGDAGPGGSLTVDATAPAFLCGGAMQLVDLSTCAPSPTASVD